MYTLYVYLCISVYVCVEKGSQSVEIEEDKNERRGQSNKSNPIYPVPLSELGFYCICSPSCTLRIYII